MNANTQLPKTGPPKAKNPRARIKVSYEDVVAAVGGHADADHVWHGLLAQTHDPFDGRRMVMWFGGVLALLASTIFLGTAGLTFGIAAFGLVLAAMMAGLLAGGWQLKLRGHHFAGGMLATLFVGLVPLLVYSVSEMLGVSAEFANYQSFFDCISSQWIWMEIATMVIGLLVVWKFDFGFITLPPTVASYFFAMDAGEGLFDLGFDSLSVAMGFLLGGAMVALGAWCQLNAKEGHATWLLLYGLLSVLFGISQAVDDGTMMALIYVPVGLGFLVLGWLLKRGIPVTIGGLSLSAALCYLTFDYFDNSILFSMVVFAVGVAIVVGAALRGNPDQSTNSQGINNQGATNQGIPQQAAHQGNRHESAAYGGLDGSRPPSFPSTPPTYLPRE